MRARPVADRAWIRWAAQSGHEGNPDAGRAVSPMEGRR